ncbi:MAG: sensor histidine kinase [Butyrivibrio sp.]|nr:sensor histidine kinase [Butyrivibrio sp.]
MGKEVRSFHENIKRIFMRFALLPVASIAAILLVMFVFLWNMFMVAGNRKDNTEISEKLSGIMDNYISMVDETAQIVAREGLSIEADDIYPIIYEKTAEYGDIGNYVLLSSDGSVIFSSKDYAPVFITGQEYLNWGVWRKIRDNEGITSVVLYEGNLCVTKGIYQNDKLFRAIVYIIPGEVISSAVGDKGRYVFVTDKNGWIYASNTKGLRDSFGQIRDELFAKTGYIRSGTTTYYSYMTDIPGKNLRVYTVNDVTGSIRIVIMLAAVIVVIFTAISIITVKSTEISSERLTKDIKKMADAFEEVQKGNLDVSLNISSSKEFQIIGNDFNEMLGGLKNQIEQNKELEHNAAFFQVKQLESQFNPHFLFNTLDNIRFMAKIDEKAADKMIVSLSGLLRYSIREIREEVTVREDLDNLQYYLNILQIRFNKRFSYSIDVSEDIMDCLIPKLLLQPLLENSVKYGFAGREKLNVKIKGYLLTGQLIFICDDDGAGMDEALLNEIKANLNEPANKSSHYGLYNINRRINLMYNGSAKLDIMGKKGEGTLIRITIPKKKG